MERNKVIVPHYNKTDRNHIRQFLLKASHVIDLIAENQVMKLVMKMKSRWMTMPCGN